MIERLAKTLWSAQIDATAEDLADTLWLALSIQKAGVVSEGTPPVDAATQQPPPAPDPSPSPVDATTVQPPPERETSPSPAPPEPETEPQRTIEETAQESEPASSLHPQATPKPEMTIPSGGLPFRSPAARALPGELGLARALRPLMRRVASRTSKVFDEPATVQCIAEQRIWMALEQPAPERWFAIDLVVDESGSMVVWQQTIIELRRLLEHHGAFRDVRVWGLKMDASDGQLSLHPETGPRALHQSHSRMTTLPDLIGRSLVLVVSDCVSPGWRRAKVTALLDQWGKRSTVAIVQVLPQRMWDGSILGLQTVARFSAAAPGVPNSALKAAIPDLLDDEATPSGLYVPVLTLEPESLAAWARVVMGTGGASVTGCIFETTRMGQESSVQQQVAAEQRSLLQTLTAEERVERFQVIASPMAQKLAGYLAAAPLTLPVMRLVQHTMLPASRQVHLAEVFLGGLLKQITPADERNPDLIQYDFVDDQVRECFLDRILLPDAVEVLRRVSADIEKRMGRGLDFESILEDPDGVGVLELDEHTRPFAQVVARVLRRLGGRYARVGERLLAATKRVRPSQPVPPTPLPAWVPELVEIPAGPFLMGSSDDDPDAQGDEKPQHELTLPAYRIGKTGVTNAQFRPFVEGDGYTNPAYWTDAGWQWREQQQRVKPGFWDNPHWNGDTQPVVGVSWYEAMAYARWLSGQTGQDYRLPTEAEWEKAARGTDGRIYPWGTVWQEGRANYRGGVGRTTPVGSYPDGASPYGALDMAGNAWEWTRSVYTPYPYTPDDGRESLEDPAKKRFVVRGGGWYLDSINLRASLRYLYSPDHVLSVLGFRLAQHLPVDAES